MAEEDCCDLQTVPRKTFVDLTRQFRENDLEGLVLTGCAEEADQGLLPHALGTYAILQNIGGENFAKFFDFGEGAVYSVATTGGRVDIVFHMKELPNEESFQKLAMWRWRCASVGFTWLSDYIDIYRDHHETFPKRSVSSLSLPSLPLPSLPSLSLPSLPSVTLPSLPTPNLEALHTPPSLSQVGEQPPPVPRKKRTKTPNLGAVIVGKMPIPTICAVPHRRKVGRPKGSKNFEQVLQSGPPRRSARLRVDPHEPRRRRSPRLDTQNQAPVVE